MSRGFLGVARLALTYTLHLHEYLRGENLTAVEPDFPATYRRKDRVTGSRL
jgi:hypothetical protein